MFSLARWSREFSLEPLSLPAPTKKKKKKIKKKKTERTKERLLSLGSV